MGQENFKPEPAESFEVDFGNTKHLEAVNTMNKMGGFVFKHGGSENGLVYFEGSRDDGTTIKIEIKKGEKYKSPKEIAEIVAKGENPFK